eukprot:6174171-Pyramimonas_sp.AAC.1
MFALPVVKGSCQAPVHVVEEALTATAKQHTSRPLPNGGALAEKTAPMEKTAKFRRVACQGGP